MVCIPTGILVVARLRAGLKTSSRNQKRFTMFDGITAVPQPANEPVLSHAPGSAERAELDAAIAELSSTDHDFTMTIGGEKRRGRGDELKVVQPHDHQSVLGTLGTAT